MARWARRGSRAEVCVQRRPRPPPCLSPRATLENQLAWRALQPSDTIRRAIPARLQRDLAGELELGVLSNITPFQARLGTFGALDAPKRCAMTPGASVPCARTYDPPFWRQVRRVCDHRCLWAPHKAEKALFPLDVYGVEITRCEVAQAGVRGRGSSRDGVLSRRAAGMVRHPRRSCSPLSQKLTSIERPPNMPQVNMKLMLSSALGSMAAPQRAPRDPSARACQRGARKFSFWCHKSQNFVVLVVWFDY